MVRGIGTAAVGAEPRRHVRRTETIGTIGMAIARITARKPRIVRQPQRRRNRFRIGGVRMAAGKAMPPGRAIETAHGSLVIVVAAAIGRRERESRPEIALRNRDVVRKADRSVLRVTTDRNPVTPKPNSSGR